VKIKCLKNIILYIIILCQLISFSCNKPGEQVQKKKPGRRELEKVNTYLAEKDRERILNYIERKNLKMTESSSGLWYCIINEGEGDFFKENDRIVMDYECTLLDGTKCYSSYETGPKTVILGKSNIEAGLAEGLKMLKPGGEAIFIIPPFLGWGLLGDDRAIPPRAVIVYEVKILNKKTPNRVQGD